MTKPDTSKSSSPERIHEARDGDKRFVLHPDDNDLFLRTGKQVIEHCRLGISLELWQKEMRSLVETVWDWSNVRNDRIQACWLAWAGAKTSMFFLPVGERFDFALAEELADLSLELGQRFNVGTIELNQVPTSELCRFVDERGSCQIYGSSREETPDAMEAQS